MSSIQQCPTPTICWTAWKFNTASTALASLCVGLHVAPSAGPHLHQSFPFVFSTVFVVKKPPTLENLSPGKHKHCRSIIGSRDTSQGRLEWPVAVVWLPDFVARLVRQV